MNVLWIADFGLQHNIGGAQRTNDFIIREGIKRGHKIEYFHYDTPIQVIADGNNNFDLIVSNNLEVLAARRPEVFDFILNHPNHVRYEHDSNSYLTNDARAALFQSAKLNIFLSDFHHHTFVKEYGPIFHNVEIVTSPVDTFVFCDKKEEREDKILNIGLMHPLKGTNDFFEYVLMNPDKQFVMAAWGEPSMIQMAKQFSNIEFLGKVPFDRMSYLYNKYTTMYYKPKKFEPFCRAVGEALLCGMKVESNDIVGAVHDYNAYGIEGLRKLCKEAPSKFWSLVG